MAAIGRLAILVCPKATLSMVFKRSILLPERSSGLPKWIFRIILPALRVNKNTAAAVKNRNKICAIIIGNRSTKLSNKD